MTTSSTLQLSPAEVGLQRWRSIVTERAWDQLPDLLADGVTYRNPSSLDPLLGKEVLAAVLGAVFTVMQNFTYLRSFDSADGHVLEFSALVGADLVFGVDILTFDEAGRITDLMVIMRPAGTVLTLAAAAGRLLGLSSTSG